MLCPKTSCTYAQGGQRIEHKQDGRQTTIKLEGMEKARSEPSTRVPRPELTVALTFHPCPRHWRVHMLTDFVTSIYLLV
jgi:hypothetical protein